MRGSVYYQTAQLTRAIFIEGLKKKDRVDPKHEHYLCVSSFKTMETYRNVWNNLGLYLKEHWNLKDFERINHEHIEAYFEYKIEYYPTKQYAEKLSSSLGKLEIALTRFSKAKYEVPNEYDFSIRTKLLNKSRRLHLVADGYHSRVYLEPESIIEALQIKEHTIAASIQLYGGARSEAVTLIKPNQLRGYKVDPITKGTVGVINTKEKGGKEGDVLIPMEIYGTLSNHLAVNEVFKLKYQKYIDDIRITCKQLKIPPHGSHGFRWTYAQNRVRTYQDHGYSYEQALQGVSWEMKHFRASITEHYLGS